MAKCSGCQAPIQWRINNVTGRRAPIDMKARPGGNVRLIGDALYQVMKEEERDADALAFIVHYGVCPEAVNNPHRDPVAHRGKDRT